MVSQKHKSKSWILLDGTLRSEGSPLLHKDSKEEVSLPSTLMFRKSKGWMLADKAHTAQPHTPNAKLKAFQKVFL